MELKEVIKIIETLTYTLDSVYDNEFIYHKDGSRIPWSELKDFWRKSDIDEEIKQEK